MCVVCVCCVCVLCVCVVCVCVLCVLCVLCVCVVCVCVCVCARAVFLNEFHIILLQIFIVWDFLMVLMLSTCSSFQKHFPNKPVER